MRRINTESTQNSLYFHKLNSFSSKYSRSCKEQDLGHSLHFICGFDGSGELSRAHTPLALTVTNPSHISRADRAQVDFCPQNSKKVTFLSLKGFFMTTEEEPSTEKMIWVFFYLFHPGTWHTLQLFPT